MTQNPARFQEKEELLSLLLEKEGLNAAQTDVIGPREKKEDLPLSFAQQRLWFLDQLEGNLVAYNMPSGFRLRGHLDTESLRRSLEAVVDRHEALRTTFQVRDGEPVQVVQDAHRFELPLIDLRDLQPEQQEEEVARRGRAEAKRPFDLAADMMLRATLVKLAEGEHLLLLSMHHIASDGWSAQILWRELSTLYASFCRNEVSPLPELAIQYADYAVWQRERLQGERLERLQKYWRTQLEGVSPLDLPTDRGRPPRPSYRGAQHSLRLAPGLVRRLRELGQASGVTLQMTLMAVFQILLARHSGQPDIAVGVPSAGRHRKELEPLIGFFIDTLALRVDLSGEPTFGELLGRVRETALRAYDHQEMPFEMLVEELQPERDLSRNPLVQVLFNMWESSDEPSLELLGLTVRPQPSQHVSTKFDITLYVRAHQDNVRIRAVYSRDLFDPDRIENMLDEFVLLLTQVVENPSRAVTDYTLVTERFRALLPDIQAPIAAPEQEPVLGQFFDCADRFPTEPAIHQGATTWSYEELADRVRDIAVTLCDAGVQSGDVIAVEGVKSFGCVASMLGVLAAGGVLLPLDPRLPQARKRSMLGQGKTVRLLHIGIPRNDRWWRDLPPRTMEVEPENGQWVDRPVNPSQARELPQVASDAPAYIFFTSGTTGTPKGILGCHQGLSHFINWQRDTFSVRPSDRCAQLTQLSFDVLLRDIFLPLTSGAALCLPEDADILDPDRIWSWLDRQQISLLHTVPSLAQFWLRHASQSQRLGHLRWVFFAGEPLTQALVQQWRTATMETGGIVNLYGPTETTLAKCFYIVPPDPPPGIQPLGSPLPQTQVLVLRKEERQLCGLGEPGEIVLRTPFATLGYLDAAVDDQKRFAPNPFQDDTGDLVYHTGDQGRYRPDGTIEFLGRFDNQVKLRGMRVELGEIEAVLAQHAKVVETVVLAREDIPGDKQLVAYVVLTQEHVPSVEELRRFLKKRLPDYMIPAAFVPVEALPLTPNGKVDHRALLALDVARQTPEASFVAPRDALEEELVEIWRDVLELDRVGIHNNFFALGGHSLIAIRLTSRINQEFEVELSLPAIFESLTIEETAIRVLEQQILASESERVKMLLKESDSDTDGRTTMPEPASAQTVFQIAESEPEVTSGPTRFHCPQSKSIWFGRRKCNLVIVINERLDAPSFETLGQYVRELDPSIDVAVVSDIPKAQTNLESRPTLIFSPAVVRQFAFKGGRTFCGYPMSKSQEYAELEKAGIPVPKWTLLTETDVPDLSEFDDYVVRKPDYGGRGSAVKIVNKRRVKWKPITTNAAGTSSALILQQLILTGARPVSYRVVTLFGKVLLSSRYTANADRPDVTRESVFASAQRPSGFSIVASGQRSEVVPNLDEQIIRLGESAHAAFPEIPLLGFDIVREVQAGQLFVLEANAIGYVWSFTQQSSESSGFSFEEQFDGVRKAAHVLAEKTQQHAC